MERDTGQALVRIGGVEVALSYLNQHSPCLRCSSLLVSPLLTASMMRPHMGVCSGPSWRRGSSLGRADGRAMARPQQRLSSTVKCPSNIVGVEWSALRMDLGKRASFKSLSYDVEGVAAFSPASGTLSLPHQKTSKPWIMLTLRLMCLSRPVSPCRAHPGCVVMIRVSILRPGTSFDTDST